MGQDKQKKAPLFPDVWWKDSPIKFGKTAAAASADGGNCSSSVRDLHNDGGCDGDDVVANGNGSGFVGDNVNYGSTNASSSSYEPLVNEGEGDQEPSFLIDKPSDFPDVIVDINNGNNQQLFGDQRPVDVQSDISNRSSSSSDSNNSNGDDDDESSCDSSDEEIEMDQPHRTLGLIFFDFLRFVAISANVRCINTQMVPVFLAWGRMEILHVALRVFITLFSILLILVEFPDLFPFLQHGIPSPLSTTTSPPSTSSPTTTPPPPPLYLTNWIPRGIFYIFLGTICFEQSIVVRALDEARHASTSSRFFDGIFIVVSGWVMLVVGVAYIILGIFCIQKVMERVRRDEKQKWMEYYEEVQRLETEREEEEERKWLLEHHGQDAEQYHQKEHKILGCWQRCLRWRRRCKRRRKMRTGGGGVGGLCYQMGCRTVDWRC